MLKAASRKLRNSHFAGLPQDEYVCSLSLRPSHQCNSEPYLLNNGLSPRFLATITFNFESSIGVPVLSGVEIIAQDKNLLLFAPDIQEEDSAPASDSKRACSHQFCGNCRRLH